MVAFGYEFPGERGCVIRDTVEILVDLISVDEAEKWLHAPIDTKLNVQLALALARDVAIERVDNLGSDDRSGLGAGGLGLVVGQVELVRVCQRAELKEDLGGEEVGRKEVIGTVVERNNIEEVKNGVGVLE